MTQANMISFKQTHANGNNSYNRSFTIRIKQIFWCFYKTQTTQLFMKIKHYLQRNSKLCCYHLKCKKHRMIVGFTTNKCRSSHQRCSVRKGDLGNFAKFRGKHLCQSLFFNKVAGLKPSISLKKRLWHRCFPRILRNFEKQLFYTERLWTTASTSTRNVSTYTTRNSCISRSP